mgnify:CR=1 FL=1
MDIIKQIENEQLRQEKFDFNVGDTVVIGYKIKEGNRERVQAFEGTVIKKQGKGSRATFTVRRVLQGVGVERTFPIHSPRIESLKVIRRGKVRRAKLYYLRDRVGKASKVKELKNERGISSVFHSFIINSRFNNRVAFLQSSVAISASAPLAALFCIR